jgi:hypothetical protein
MVGQADAKPAGREGGVEVACCIAVAEVSWEWRTGVVGMELLMAGSVEIYCIGGTRTRLRSDRAMKRRMTASSYQHSYQRQPTTTAVEGAFDWRAATCVCTAGRGAVIEEERGQEEEKSR